MIRFGFEGHSEACAIRERRQRCILRLLTAFWPDPGDGNARDGAVYFLWKTRSAREGGFLSLLPGYRVGPECGQ